MPVLDHESSHMMLQREYKAGLLSHRRPKSGCVGSRLKITCKFFCTRLTKKA